MNQQPSIGRIVEFFPGTTEYSKKLPNGAESAPAVISQIFEPHCNLHVFVYDNISPVRIESSIPQKGSKEHKLVGEDSACWDWPKKVN